MNNLKQQLASLHEQLTSAQDVDADTRQQLLVLLADISRLLHPAMADESSVADKLESATIRFDADHPALSNAIRQLVDALGKAGI